MTNLEQSFCSIHTTHYMVQTHVAGLQERPDAVLPTMGGQTSLNLAKALSEVSTVKWQSQHIQFLLAVLAVKQTTNVLQSTQVHQLCSVTYLCLFMICCMLTNAYLVSWRSPHVGQY